MARKRQTQELISSFLKKSALGLEKGTLIVLIYRFNFSVVLGAFRIKNSEIFPCGTFLSWVEVVFFHVYWSTLIPIKFSCSEKFLVAPLKLVLELVLALYCLLNFVILQSINLLPCSQIYVDCYPSTKLQFFKLVVLSISCMMVQKFSLITFCDSPFSTL